MVWSPPSHRTIAKATRAALRLMPEDGDLDTLLQNLAQQRGRPITVIDYDPLPDRLPSGVWVKAQDRDVILVEEGVGPSRRALIISHEIAHMVLDHHGDCTVSDLVRNAAPDLAPALIERVLHRDTYESAAESEAEEVATLIAVEHSRRRRNAELNANPISARLR